MGLVPPCFWCILPTMSFNTGIAQRTNAMDGWRNLHPGYVPLYRDKKRHANWRWGNKKGLRRARRRLGRALVQETE